MSLSNDDRARESRTLGTLKSKIQILDPDWWKPMTDREVEDFLAGRDYSKSHVLTRPGGAETAAPERHKSK